MTRILPAEDPGSHAGTTRAAAGRAMLRHMNATLSFPLRYSRPGRLMGLLGMGPSRSGVTVTPDALEVRMGWGFRMRAPRDRVVAAAPRAGRPPLSRGVHGWRGRWLVNGAGDGLVRIVLHPAAPARVVGLPVRVHELTVSVGDPEGLAAALSG